MRFLRTNTAVRLTVGPFMDKTDGVTPETSLTVTSCKLTLMVDDGNVPTLVLDAAATGSGGNNDMVHVTNDDAGFYDLELTAANLNYLGRAMLSITDATTHCPVFHEFMILPAMVYDSLVLGTDVLQADVTQLAGVAQSLTDLKDFADDGYDPSTNKVAGVVLVDTLTTYTGNTPQTGDGYAIVNSGTHGNAAIKGYVDDIGVAGAGLTAADDAILAAIAALNNIAAADVWSVATRVLTAGTNIQLPSNGLDNVTSWAMLTSALPDSVPADGTRPSLQQAAYMICQGLFEGSISGTTWTVKKVDGSTALFTITLDSATSPTSKTRAT